MTALPLAIVGASTVALTLSFAHSAPRLDDWSASSRPMRNCGTARATVPMAMMAEAGDMTGREKRMVPTLMEDSS